MQDSDNPTEPGGVSGTRQRLIGAAAEVFAEKGFRRATIREIVGRADANLNAVNYHFGDKEGLYRAVIEWTHTTADQDEGFDRAADGTLAPAERLHAFVQAFLRRAILRKHVSLGGRLMTLEMLEPTGVLDMVVERFIRQKFEVLTGIVRSLVGDGASQEMLERCAASVVGQCMHLAHGRPIITRLIPYVSYSPEGVERMAEHVTRFSLAALTGLRAAEESAE